MKAEESANLRYLLQDDIYLLAADRSFYRNKPEPQNIPQPETPKVEIKYMGGYKNEFLIITHYPAHVHMEPAHLTALESTLARIGLSNEDVAIFNLAAHAGVNYEEVIKQLQPQKIVILGADALPVEAPFITQNQPQPAGEAILLYTFSFGEMMGNKENTKTFWNLIKQF